MDAHAPPRLQCIGEPSDPPSIFCIRLNGLRVHIAKRLYANLSSTSEEVNNMYNAGPWRHGPSRPVHADYCLDAPIDSSYSFCIQNDKSCMPDSHPTEEET